MYEPINRRIILRPIIHDIFAMPAHKKKFRFDFNVLEECSAASGLPPRRASCMKKDSYWYLVCKHMFVNIKLTSKEIKKVAQCYYCNYRGIRDRLIARLQVRVNNKCSSMFHYKSKGLRY